LTGKIGIFIGGEYAMIDERSQEDILEALKEEVQSFPAHPGVYLMRDEKGAVIYVGKAKHLKNRVRSYFGVGDGRHQIRFLMRRVCAIDKILTDSEEHAFVLERDLITKYKPRYNIRLKDDKAHLSVRIDRHKEWPRLQLVRKTENDGAKYFGPYTFSYELRTVLDVIKKVVPLRTCTDTVFYNRQRPCLEYQIKRCLGPCCLEVSREEYDDHVQEAISILEGRTEGLEQDIERRMERASEDMRFEDAAKYRDKLEVLKNFGKGHQLISHGAENRDVFALYREERLATLAVLQVKNGRIADSRNFVFTEVEVSDEDVLESAIEQLYESAGEIPEEIILPMPIGNEEFIRERLSRKRGRVVNFTVPKRGIKFRLLGLAELNARENYISRFDAEQQYTEVARGLARMVNLSGIPRRIECVDISNFQGSDIVGGLVCFYDGRPDKNRYRKYKIKGTTDCPDDFASIKEVVARRLSRGIEEDDLPDLLVIDGGPGQLSAALEGRDESGSSVDIISLAKMRTEKRGSTSGRIKKKPERIYCPGIPEPILLDERSEVTKFLQRVRDEVHRFAITFHRSSRSKRVFQSALDEVRGIGPERKKRLLRQFGSVSGMKGVSAEELARVGRMPLGLAHKLIKALA
jgi:excinuclease ABC subunit C